MNELYWITVIGNVHNLLVMAVVVVLLLFVVFIIETCISIAEKDESLYKSNVKYTKLSFCVLWVFAILHVFIPSERQLLRVYGVGSTIDYLKDNPHAKQIPNKAIIALEKYLDELNEEQPE